MATQSKSFDNPGNSKALRKFDNRNGRRNLDFSPSTRSNASQRGASRIGLQFERPGHGHSSDDSGYARADSSAESADGASVTGIDFAELSDGILVELAQDPKERGRTCFAVWKDGEIRFVDQLEQDGQIFVPPSRKDEVLRSLRLPSAATPYESVRTLLHRLESFLSQCVAIDNKYLPVLADFILSTWLVDRFEVAPYLSVVGLPQSGKTTLLRVLSLVCRRSLLIADITSAALYDACARFKPTILIDEAGSVRNDRTLRHILRSGTTRDVYAVRRNCALHSYGAKVISWLEPPDDPALNSRCILIPMFENKNGASVKLDEADVQQMAADLRARLLTFRFENYKTVKPVAVAGDESLRPRTRDLLRTLSAVHAQDVERCQGLLKLFESGEAVPLEPLSREQNAVLRALFSAIHLHADFACILVGDLTNIVNVFLERAGERIRLLPRKVGAVLTSLSCCTRERTNSGWTIRVNRQDAEKLHQLAARYGIDGFADKYLRVSLDDCSLCRATGLNKKRREAAAPDRIDLRPEAQGVLNKLSTHFKRKV